MQLTSKSSTVIHQSILHSHQSLPHLKAIHSNAMKTFNSSTTTRRFSATTLIFSHHHAGSLARCWTPWRARRVWWSVPLWPPLRLKPSTLLPLSFSGFVSFVCLLSSQCTLLTVAYNHSQLLQPPQLFQLQPLTTTPTTLNLLQQQQQPH